MLFFRAGHPLYNTGAIFYTASCICTKGILYVPGTKNLQCIANCNALNNDEKHKSDQTVNQTILQYYYYSCKYILIGDVVYEFTEVPCVDFEFNGRFYNSGSCNSK